MRQASARGASLVDPGKERLARLGRGAQPPGLRDELELGRVELGDRARVPRRVDHDLLLLESRVLVRHDADRPAGRVGGTALGRQRERLWWGQVFAALAERASVELAVRD